MKEHGVIFNSKHVHNFWCKCGEHWRAALPLVIHIREARESEQCQVSSQQPQSLQSASSLLSSSRVPF